MSLISELFETFAPLGATGTRRHGMDTFKTDRLRADPDAIRRAAELLRAGQLVSFPTETVYGLGADARNGNAVAGVYAAKGRPAFNPLIIHVTDVETARRYVQWNSEADRLASVFWPGPLTMVLPISASGSISSLVTAGLETVAVRVPAHPVAQSILRDFDGPVAAPSANPSGKISPTTADHVWSGLGGKIAAIVDGGPCEVGLESTILNMVDTPTLLRPGGLPIEAINAALGHDVVHPAANAPITAPGQLTSHYAPGSTVRLNADGPSGNEVFLGFGAMDGDVNLSRAEDLMEAAAGLFDALHKLDAMGRPIAVAPIPNTGLGVAINDRLHRAAAPRPS